MLGVQTQVDVCSQRSRMCLGLFVFVEDLDSGLPLRLVQTQQHGRWG